MPPDGYELHPITLGDADALAAAFVVNRDHLAPWEPDRDEAFYTADGQRASIRAQLALVEQGRLRGWVLWYDERVVGRLALSNIVRGVLLSASVGYWVDRDHQGRGLAKTMVEFACERAFDLGLHRVEAGTMVENDASQAVLRACGFQHYGTAEKYLFLAGAWRDHHLFQRLIHDFPAGAAFL